jgi:hypothetical protein
VTIRAFETTVNPFLDAEFIDSDQKNTRSLPFLVLNDIRHKPSSKGHLIKGVMARGETSAWIGPPGSLKSALMAHVDPAAAAILAELPARTEQPVTTQERGTGPAQGNHQQRP